MFKMPKTKNDKVHTVTELHCKKMEKYNFFSWNYKGFLLNSIIQQIKKLANNSTDLNAGIFGTFNLETACANFC